MYCIVIYIGIYSYYHDEIKEIDMKAPASVTSQAAMMTEEIKVLQAKTIEAQHASTVADEVEAEAAISAFNQACVSSGLGSLQMISRAKYQASYGRTI
jgi:hypothetical protein